MEKLHPKAVWLFFVSSLGRLVILFFAFGFIAMEVIVEGTRDISNDALWKVGLSALLAIIAYIIICYIWAKLTYRFWGYELTETALKIEKGVIWKKYVSIPYERIQNVDIFRGLLARMLGLSDLQVQTAGYSGGYHSRGRMGFMSEGRLPGLSPSVAEQLREELVRKARGVRQGQGINQGL